MALQNARFKLGTNLFGVRDWATQYPLVDFFKSSRPWITQANGVWNTGEQERLNLDEHGWVKSLPTPEDNLQFTRVVTLLPNTHRGDRLIVFYDGEGLIQYAAGARKVEAESSLGRDVIETTPDRPLHLSIVQTDPGGTGNYIRNIRVIPEHFVSRDEPLIFNPDFIARITPYKVLRFMDWMETNHSTQGEWHQIPDIADSNYAHAGMPLAIMVDLCNFTGISPWFNMPHRATDEYVHNFAQFVKEHLASHLDIYVEFSNEVWNGQFQQSAYVAQRGRQEWPDSRATNFTLGVDWYSKRTTEIMQIWDAVFGADKERVKGVMAGQAANPGVLRRALDYAWASPAKNHLDYGIDAIAIAPYFGGYLGQPANAPELESWMTDPDGGLTKLFSEITNGGVLSNSPPGGALQQASERMATHSELAQQHGLELIAYEGGQHLVGVGPVTNNAAITNLLIAANRDSRMGDVYRTYLTSWQNSGLGLLVHFTDITVPSMWGSWGALETIYQDSSPKHAVLMEFSRSAPDEDPVEQNHYRQAAQYSEANDGLAMVIVQSGAVVFESYAPGISPEQGNPLASGTKSFCGAIALLAVQDGLLTLDEPVAKTITEWKRNRQKSRITIRQLLNLTSGLQGGQPGNIPSYTEAISAPLTAPPGTRFQYGPIPFQVFGELMRRKFAARGMAETPLTYLHSRIFQPMGLQYDCWRAGPDGQPNLPSGALMSAREWAKYGVLILNRGQWQGQQLLDADQLTQCFQGTTANPAYGITFWLNQDGILPSGQPTHSIHAASASMVMAIGSGNQVMFVLPEHDRVVVRQGRLHQQMEDVETEGFDREQFLNLVLTEAG